MEKPKQQLKTKDQVDTKVTDLETLERQISDYLHLLPVLTQDEKEKSWNSLLSLFLQIFDNVSNNWMTKFPSIIQFSIEASRVMVQTIKWKLGDKPGGEARFAVEKHFQRQREGSNDGWKLLQAVHLLSTVDSETLPGMVSTGLPLILLKCMQLFTFPSESETEIIEKQDTHTEFQETITHVMLNLCTQVPAVEAMIESDDLERLILAVVSQWDQCSSWRQYTSHVLRAVSKTPTKNTIRYLHDTKCVQRCIQGVSAMARKTSVYVAARAAVNISCFIKDSYQVSGELLADFEKNEGYELLAMLLLGFHKELEKDEEKSLEELVDFLSCLTICGEKELKVIPSVTGSQFPHFKFQQPPKSDTTVKNLLAFKVLQTALLNSNCSYISSIILDRVKKIWSWNKANFFLLEWTQQVFFQFAEVVYLKSEAVQIQYFQMLRFIVFDLSYIPHEIFSRVQAIIRENFSPVCAVLALECVLDICKCDPLLSVVFRETRLLDILLTRLQRCAKLLRKAGNRGPSDDQQHQREVLSLMLKVVAIMLQGSVKNVVILREYGMIPYIKIFLDDKSYRSHALDILEQLFVVNAEEYMRVVIGVLCSATRGEFMLKLDLLQSINELLDFACNCTLMKQTTSYSESNKILAASGDDFLEPAFYSLLNVLGMSKAHSAFRTAGGFNALQSVLADMEGALCDPPSTQWSSVDQTDVWELIEMTLCTLVVSLHSDPVNSYFFRKHSHFDKLTDDLRLLGCFNDEGGSLCHQLDIRACRTFKEFLDLADSSTADLPPSLKSCVKIFGFLDGMAKDAISSPLGLSGKYHPPSYSESSNQPDVQEISQHNASDNSEKSSEQLDAGDAEDRFSTDAVIVHPGAICVMIHLLPNINCSKIPQIPIALLYIVDLFCQTCCSVELDDTSTIHKIFELCQPIATAINEQLSLELQYAIADYILSLVKSERSRQTMCGSNLLKVLVNRFKEVLAENSNPLHFPLIRIFEKLACQAIDPPVLRAFLRLGDPLNCAIGKPQKCGLSCKSQTIRSWHQIDSNETGWHRSHTRRGSLVAKNRPHLTFGLSCLPKQMSIPWHRVMSLVSMMSSRHFHPTKSTAAPSFTEFDMSVVGYGCYFLPTVATVLGPNADSLIIGGIGTGYRGFPPPGGLTYSTWFLIHSFTSASDDHPVRLLTLFRHMSKMEKDYICLSINISASENKLVISTQEEVFEPLDWNKSEQAQQSSALTTVEFDVSKDLVIGQWHHLAVTMSKDVRRNSTVLAYLNGKLIGISKMQYIQTFPGTQISLDSASVIDVHGLIGTPQIWKQRSSLVWRLGPAYLLEDVISAEKVKVIYQLGPNYLGNFQSVYLPVNDLTDVSAPSFLVTVEKVSFGINVTSSDVMTITDIRKAFNEVDSRIISSEMGISSRDDAMPIVMVKNTASHLPGPSRTIGSPLASFFGVRTFISNPAANCLQFLGGPAVILGLVAMVSDDGEMYAAIKVLISVLNGSALCEREMQRIKGYRLLALLLKRKVQLLNARIFQLVLTIVGTVELGQGSSTIWNLCAFRDLLCDFELWLQAPEKLDLLLLRHFLELLESSDGRRNAELMHKLQVEQRLVFLLNDPKNTRTKVHLIHDILAHLLRSCFSMADFLRIGLFLTYTLPPASMNETFISLERISDTSIDVINQVSGRMIWLRNQLLQTLLDVLRSDHLNLTSKDQEKMFASLGPDWFFLFLQAHLHPTTVVLSTSLMLHFLYNPTLLAKFRDGMAGNVWLENCTAECTILMNNIKSCAPVCNKTPWLVPGLEMFQMFLNEHVAVPQLYVLLAALVLQKPLPEMVEDTKLYPDTMIPWIFDQVRANQREKPVKITNGLCIEAALILLGMVRTILSKPFSGAAGSWEVTYPDSVIQFFNLTYDIFPNDPLWMSPEFLQALAAAAFHLEESPNYTVDSRRLLQETVESQPHLSTHPAQKQATDFTRVLLLDSLLKVPANKLLHPVDILVESSLEKATEEQRKTLQTQILLFVMDIFHIIMEEQSVIKPLARDSPAQMLSSTEGSLVTLFGNVTYFSQRIVDKLFAGRFDVNPQHILHFLTKQICKVLDLVYFQKDHVVSNLYSSLNRAILYCLSRPRQSPSDLLILLNTLKFLHEQWDIIFATYNSSISFTICLIHCLCQIKTGSYPNGFGVGTCSKKASWYAQSAANSEQYDGSFESICTQDAQKEVFNLVEWVWNHLMTQRRLALEDCYKIELSVKQGSNEKVVGISEVSPLWEESASRAWLQYIASEKKNVCSKGNSGQLQQNKAEWFSESLSSAMRLVGKRFLREHDDVTIKDFIIRMDTQRKTGQDVFSSLHIEHMQMQKCILNRASKDWAKVEQQLLQERGLWGPTSRSQQGAWILSMAEGPSRMRKKMRRQTICINSAFDACRTKEAKSEISGNPGSEQFYLKLCSTDEHVRRTDYLGESDVDEQGIDCSQLTFFPALGESVYSEEFFEQCVERQAIFEVLVEKEKINRKFTLIVAEGHLLMESVLLFGKSHFYICENFTLSSSDDVYCTNHHPSSINDSYIYDMCNKETGGKTPTCYRYHWHEVEEIQHRRFLLQDVAFEIFFKSGFSKFLIFHKNDKKNIFKQFCNLIPSLKKGGFDTTRSHSKSVVEKGVIQKWQKGGMSNFEYLMYLNTLAGRTYKDLMQYPVFPWILADYDSEELDLTNAKTFRDLSRPMGAQTEERKDKFVKRYFEIDNDGNLSIKCHYCTHYSSAMIVTSYLVRMEPFTEIFCTLQGGCFDVADRMFFSIKKEWESASRDNMSDVRELTPEFFYLPEFLLNHNQMEFGSMQDGTTLGDVVLPPWAKGDAREFIRLHRTALESEYVSTHLHHWIDLIFGYKQKGPNAVEAVNVFHPYFYDDQVDLNIIKDPMKKDTIFGFVNNFGQIPKQLFKKAHPPRLIQGKHLSGKDSFLLACTQPFFYHLEMLKPSVVPVTAVMDRAVGHIAFTEKGVLAIEKNTLLLPPHWNKTFSWGYDDYSCSLGSYGNDKSQTVFECLSDWGQCLCAACPTPTMVFTGGTSSVICVWEMSSSKEKLKSMVLKEVLHGHTEAVTCLAVSLSYNVIVSGSCDWTCIIWDFNTLSYVSQLQPHEAAVSTVSINNVTGDIVSCAGTYLYLWTLNGQPVAKVNTSAEPEKQILCCCSTEMHEWDSHNVVITGCADGTVQLWRTEFTRVQVSRNDKEPTVLQHIVPDSEKHVVHRWEHRLVLCRELSQATGPSGKQNKRNPAVTALAIPRNHMKLFVGDSWGRVHAWSMDG